jgi:hypothetical protein
MHGIKKERRRERKILCLCEKKKEYLAVCTNKSDAFKKNFQVWRMGEVESASDIH